MCLCGVCGWVWGWSVTVLMFFVFQYVNVPFAVEWSHRESRSRIPISGPILRRPRGRRLMDGGGGGGVGPIGPLNSSP